MIIETPIVCVILGVFFAMQGWTMMQVIDLKAQIAAMSEHCLWCGGRPKKDETKGNHHPL